MEPERGREKELVKETPRTRKNDGNTMNVDDASRQVAKDDGDFGMSE